LPRETGEELRHAVHPSARHLLFSCILREREAELFEEGFAKFSRYEGKALSGRRRGLWVMKQETLLRSGGN